MYILRDKFSELSGSGYKRQPGGWLDRLSDTTEKRAQPGRRQPQGCERVLAGGKDEVWA
jgi:hypothetical protein